jgi:hypothetical protein
MYQHNEYRENVYITESDVQIQCNLHKNYNDILHRKRKSNPKIHMERQKALNSQSNTK